MKHTKRRRERALQRLKAILLNKNHLPKRYANKELSNEEKQKARQSYEVEVKGEISKLEERIKKAEK